MEIDFDIEFTKQTDRITANHNFPNLGQSRHNYWTKISEIIN